MTKEKFYVCSRGILIQKAIAMRERAPVRRRWESKQRVSGRAYIRTTIAGEKEISLLGEDVHYRPLKNLLNDAQNAEGLSCQQ